MSNSNHPRSNANRALVEQFLGKGTNCYYCGQFFPGVEYTPRGHNCQASLKSPFEFNGKSNGHFVNDGCIEAHTLKQTGVLYLGDKDQDSLFWYQLPEQQFDLYERQIEFLEQQLKAYREQDLRKEVTYLLGIEAENMGWQETWEAWIKDSDQVDYGEIVGSIVGHMEEQELKDLRWAILDSWRE